jgi:hypothetical protein
MIVRFFMSERQAHREVIVPAPEGAWRKRLPILGALWAALMLAIPLRYYLGDDAYDERFAWRMFSAVRVQSCQAELEETRAANERVIPLMEVLPAPWAALLERNRIAVAISVLRWRCEQDGVTNVRIRSTCRDASGQPLAATERRIDCDSSEITATRGEER